MNDVLFFSKDHIVDFASRWFDTTSDYEKEDWDAEIKENHTAESEQDSRLPTEEAVPIITSDSIDFSHLRTSATGARINQIDAGMTSSIAVPSKYSLRSSTHHLGTFSRLLLTALEQLIKKHHLCLVGSSKVYATRLEMRAPSTRPSLIRKIYITPSTVFYEGPYEEEKCAVTRHYEEYQDRFLRVVFRDEGKYLSFFYEQCSIVCFICSSTIDYRVLHDYNDNMSKMYERIKDTLNKGVNICDRNYQFLAFSSSQLREHSCWMFAAPNSSTTVDTIRRWMGDFSNIHPVAKYAARVSSMRY